MRRGVRDRKFKLKKMYSTGKASRPHDRMVDLAIADNFRTTNPERALTTRKFKQGHKDGARTSSGRHIDANLRGMIGLF